MRKILLLLTSMIMALGMAACGNSDSGEEELNTPEAAVIGLLDGIKALDQTKINEYVTEDDIMYSTNIGESTDVAVFENLTYNVESVHTNEDRAVVTVEIANVNMTAVFQTYLENVMSSGEDVHTMTEEDAMEKLKEAIEQNKDNKISRTMDLSVTQVDGQWKVTTTEDFLSIISGGMADEMAFE